MSDTPEPEDKQVNEGRPWLAIFINADDSIKVTGFINDKMTSYALLECAKDSIREHINKQAKIERVNASGGLMGFIRNGRH